ncbi:hypothetical protein LguiA_017903 [Lonicera macranthoides]
MATRFTTTTNSQFTKSPSSLVSSITSLLQTLNPQNPDPSLLNQFSPHLNPNFVTQVINNNQTNPDHALLFFNWASNPNPNPTNYSHTHHCYIAITDLLLSHNLFSKATQLLQSSNKFSDFMVGKFIKAHGDRGHIQWAMHLFHQVKNREMGRCLFSYNAILGVLVRANRVDLARGIFDEIVKEGVVNLDVSTYTTMIRGFCKMGMIADAEKVFDEMPCKPNLVTYNTLVNGFCKKGLMESARILVSRMVESKDCLPDTKGKLDEAKKCFDEMVSRNCEPNVLTYNALVYGMCLSGNVDEAKRMLSKMRLNGLKDDVATHTSLLKGYCIIGRLDEAAKHLKEMVSLGMEPDVKSYGVVVNECCKLNKPNEAIRLLSEMKGRGISPSVSSFNAVFRVLVDSGELDRAILLLKQMPQMGCSPNFLSYNAVILGLIRAKRRMRQVERLVSDMRRDGHNLDATLYSCLLEAYCEEGSEEMAMQVFQEMIDKAYVVNLESFAISVKLLCDNGKVFEAEKFFEKMSCSCPVIDLDRYRRVLDAYICESTSKMGEEISH